MSRFTERNPLTMVGGVAMANVYRLGGGDFVDRNPFTMPANVATYIGGIGMYRQVASYPTVPESIPATSNPVNVGTVGGERELARPVSAFRIPTPTCQGK